MSVATNIPAPGLGGACNDCGVAEGELHAVFCDMDGCPVCGRQALQCDHCYTVNGRPRKRFLATRAPYVEEPVACAHCLRPYPVMFKVTDHEWRANVPASLRHTLLCRACYERIAAWMQAAREAAS